MRMIKYFRSYLLFLLLLHILIFCCCGAQQFRHLWVITDFLGVAQFLILFIYYCRRFLRWIKEIKSPAVLLSKLCSLMHVIVNIKCIEPLTELLANHKCFFNFIPPSSPFSHESFISWSKFIDNMPGHSFLIKIKDFLQQFVWIGS